MRNPAAAYGRRSRQTRIIAPSPLAGAVVTMFILLAAAPVVLSRRWYCVPAVEAFLAWITIGHTTITFITGANMGRETARRLAELGHTVLIGARDRQGRRGRGRARRTLRPIDVTDDESVAAADIPRPRVQD
ncbi:hypothetical protein [Lentzea cavernae]|uniref:Short chain dehydrogenase n=1 Tax=Lentzea cavernae TaxID=2020703 RepID=A0ABQ3MHB7_9PSEU|nr:hypothetical protein [Lentzea cavernae]GHH42406.1 hypothetical protein GCM10017774_38730 [Lentzea cavernae]